MKKIIGLLLVSMVAVLLLGSSYLGQGPLKKSYNRVSLTYARPGDCVWINFVDETSTGKKIVGAVLKVVSVENDIYRGVLFLPMVADTTDYLCGSDGVCIKVGKSVNNMEFVTNADSSATTKDGYKVEFEYVTVGYCVAGINYLK